jgi:endoglucanase
MFKPISIATLLIIAAIGCAQNSPELSSFEKINLNQLGYYPSAPKYAVVKTDQSVEFAVVESSTSKKIFTGKLQGPRESEFSDKETCIADFSSVTKPGSYILEVTGIGKSYQFEIKPNVYDEVSKASIKGFYYQRLSTELPEKFAGKWKRPAGNPDNKVLVHSSAASDKRPEGTILSSPRGWLDAGDYNKYIVNSGITMGTLLSAYEDFPLYYKNLSLNIPESNNSIPDLLDETLWNLRWMLTMQDPNDGGVYHKLTNPNFDKMVMPHQCNNPRYVVQKGTAAALDFAAVMAQSSRVFKEFSNELPGLADSCLSAATKAWEWAERNPNIAYEQNELNKQFDPDITTGAYGDRNFSDEKLWAAAELYATTLDTKYLQNIPINPTAKAQLPSWNQVQLLGFYSLIRNEKNVPTPAPMLSTTKDQVVALANDLAKNVKQRSYMTVMGGSPRDFIWGSSSVAANQGIVLINAYKITGDKKYIAHALTNVDYLLGRNATGYSFVTGHGDKTPMHIHHRPSEADGIAEPVPGLLSGGPNPGKQDGCVYASSIPNEAFTDDVCSYASNEIAINWNAPLVYLLGSMEALQDTVGYSKR